MGQRAAKETYREGYLFERLLRIALTSLVIAALSPHSTASAVQITLGWDPPAGGPAVDGYRVYSRLEGQSYSYSEPTWQGTTTTCTIADVQAVTSYFVARAYNAFGESGDSNEVTYQPSTSPGDNNTGSSSGGSGGGGGAACFMATAASESSGQQWALTLILGILMCLAHFGYIARIRE